MRMGKVMLYNYYVVDLDNEDQVEDAKVLLCEDMDYAVTHDDLGGYIETFEDPSLQEKDIHPVLCNIGKDVEG